VYTIAGYDMEQAVKGTHFLHNHPDLVNSLTENNRLKYKFPMNDGKFLKVCKKIGYSPIYQYRLLLLVPNK
jgi:hypothetical protein